MIELRPQIACLAACLQELGSMAMHPLTAAKAGLKQWVRSARNSHLAGRDFTELLTRPSPVGSLAGDPLLRLGIGGDELVDAAPGVEFTGKARYLNGASAVVTHTVDDTNEYLPACLDAMDRYSIKATLFVTTGYQPMMSQLWPRLRQAIANGHEIGAHSRRHPCRIPDSSLFCFRALTRYEIEGSRQDILDHSGQSYVWSWAYPCGHCAGREFIQRKLAHAGYLVARTYPDELEGRHEAPDLQTYDSNPYAVRYTQIAQKSYSKMVPKRGEVTISGRTDVPVLNAKFDEVHSAGGIYTFVSHPQMLEYGKDAFYERHLAHVGGREDVWYVPLGPLYAYRVLSEKSTVQPLMAKNAVARFAVFNRLDSRIYKGSITLKFRNSAGLRAFAGGRELSEQAAGPVRRWDGEYFRRTNGDLLVTVRPNTVVEFREPGSRQGS
jgi:peptidoglycan/xylan/chitin deacetylase (PgdA/CDA1 family)